MEKLIGIVIQLVGGAAGGNVIEALLKDLKLTRIVATITGIIGGIGAGQLADWMGWIEKIFGSADGAAAQVIGDGGVAAIGGAIVTAIVGYIQSAMTKKTA
jgi:hypothetical protein